MEKRRGEEILDRSSTFDKIPELREEGREGELHLSSARL